MYLFFSDIALIKLGKGVFKGSFIEPYQISRTLELTEADVRKAQFIEIAGWGITEKGTDSDQLMSNFVDLGDMQGNALRFTHPAGEGSCRGDSGGMCL